MENTAADQVVTVKKKRVLGKEVTVVVISAEEVKRQRKKSLPFLEDIIKSSESTRANVALVNDMKPLL